MIANRANLLAIVFATGLVLLISVAFMRNGSSRRTECVYNLRTVYLKYTLYFMEDGKTVSDAHEWMASGQRQSATRLSVAQLMKILGNPVGVSWLTCPKDVAPPPPPDGAVLQSNLSYFFTLENPFSIGAERIVAGTRNVTTATNLVTTFTDVPLSFHDKWRMHGKSGFILFADGSVQGTANEALASLGSQTANTINIVLFP